MLTTGVALDRYLVFCKLLRAGYIVQRHPARWLLRPGEDPGQAWAGWGQAPAAPLEAAGRQQQQQQPKQQKVMQQTTATPASPPAARPAKRRKVLVQYQLEPRGWWALEAEAAGTQRQEAAADGNQKSDASSSAAAACASSIGTNPWLRGMPAGFLDTLPKVEVVPDAVQRARLDFPRMAPLQVVALPDLQLQAGPAGGRHLLVRAFWPKLAGLTCLLACVLLHCCTQPSPDGFASHSRRTPLLPAALRRVFFQQQVQPQGARCPSLHSVCGAVHPPAHAPGHGSS